MSLADLPAPEGVDPEKWQETQKSLRDPGFQAKAEQEMTQARDDMLNLLSHVLSMKQLGAEGDMVNRLLVGLHAGKLLNDLAEDVDRMKGLTLLLVDFLAMELLEKKGGFEGIQKAITDPHDVLFAGLEKIPTLPPL